MNINEAVIDRSTLDSVIRPPIEAMAARGYSEEITARCKHIVDEIRQLRWELDGAINIMQKDPGISLPRVTP